HEYTAANASFAYSIEPENLALKQRILQIIEARDQNMPTVPSILGDELATNPFLRPDSPAIRQRLGMQSNTDAEVFTEIRRLKNSFKPTKIPDLAEDPCNCAYD
ncbi:hypothetical protein JI58_00185, partial [Marinosulfonomonas sp. PRT-SC04]